MQILRYLGYFNPRPLRGGRPDHRQAVILYVYFNPRPLRGGRLGYTFLTLFYSGVISIHALYEEGDMILFLTPSKPSISIHALYEEGDLIVLTSPKFSFLFQSTPSTRRATIVNLYK